MLREGNFFFFLTERTDLPDLESLCTEEICGF